ncbi:MAG: sugar phosphate isomerase/epimerase [Anaerolineaceae bacterium]|nr:sugar phosphate isomerase/epimerase [Anaerolineaceae bacterium]
MKIGVNSVLFGGYDMETAFRTIAMAGFDGIELSALDGMSEHLVLSKWQELVPVIKELSKTYGLELLAMELADSRNLEKMETGFQAAAEIGIPIINTGPRGEFDNDEEWQKTVDALGACSKMGEKYGVTVCVKAHVRASIYNTATTLKVMEAIPSPSFGIDMDPSHIWRGGENPVEAIAAVISRVKHVHIRDCKGRQTNPGLPPMQANGRGDIDLVGYVRVLHEAGYTGPVDLEVIGARELDLVQCAIIAAETRGHLQASLQACGAR